MNILDEEKTVKQLDKNNYYASVEQFPSQCDQAWKEVKSVFIPEEYKKAENIVVCGMGGSGLGSWVVKSLFFDRLKVPFEVINDYSLPSMVNEKSLVILSSYSGTTEEVLTAFGEVQRREAKCLGIGTGGDLIRLMKDYGFPFYLIDPKYNPSGQPRAGVGYSIMGVVGMLVNGGFLEVTEEEIEEMIKSLNIFVSQYALGVPTVSNLAKQISLSLKEKIVILVGAEHLGGSLHVFRNQLHETAKNFADFYLLPELNHHLMEGLSFPKSNPQNFVFLFLESSLYSQRISQRIAITKEVVTQNKIPILNFSCTAKDKIGQAFEVILLGGFVSFYLAMLNGIDPSVIPWVDYFKNRLKQF